MIYNIHLLPARFGDAILIEYGDTNNPRRILIDGGTGSTSQHILSRLGSTIDLELLVITHIDRDHIEGILKLLETTSINIRVGDTWFNGWSHLPGNEPQKEAESFGAKHGERLTAAILKRRLPWNQHFHQKAVAITNDDELPTFELEGGMKITLLSPYREQLSALRTAWEDEIVKAGLIPGYGEATQEPAEPESATGMESFGAGTPNIAALLQEPFEEDSSAANGSSIAFLATFQGKTVLFAGDALPSVLKKSLDKLSPGTIPMDLAKLSHHASAGNTSPTLIDKLDTKQFAISTNGSIYHHPAQVTVARAIHQKGHGVKLHFNYRSKWNQCWEDTGLQQLYQYSTVYPEHEGITISLF